MRHSKQHSMQERRKNRDYIDIWYSDSLVVLDAVYVGQRYRRIIMSL